MTALSKPAQLIYNLVSSARVGTTMVEIEQALRLTGNDPHGELGIRVTAWENIYMWTDVNPNFVAWMKELTDPDLVHFAVTSPLIYTYDAGRLPPIPIVERIPRVGDGFDEPHWLPVVVNLGPPLRDGEAADEAPEPRSRYALYRLFGAAGELLYIGQSMDPGKRFRTHSRQKLWWDDIDDINIRRYPTKEAVCAAEKEAIIAERPKYNVVHNAAVRQAGRTR